MPLKLEHLKDDIVRMHESGMSMYKIAQHFREYEQAVSSIIKKYGNHQKRSFYSFDENFFETIDTEEKAYFLGFIAADGCLQDNGSGVVYLSITIKNTDLDILEKMKVAMNAQQPIIHLKRDNMVRITFTRKKLTSDLMKYDLTERKSVTMGSMIHHIPEHLKHHFIRGYFDGDGSIMMVVTSGTQKRPYVCFRGTEDFLLPISEWFDIKGYMTFSNGIHMWRFGAKTDVQKFYNIIYRDATVFMSRKHDKFPK